MEGVKIASVFKQHLTQWLVANVEIKTGQKSVMDYLIKPLNKVNEALRER